MLTTVIMIRGSVQPVNSTVWLGWRACLKTVTKTELQDSSGNVQVTQRTYGYCCPILIFTFISKRRSGNTLFRQNKCSNGMSSEAPRKQSRLMQNTKKITLTVQIVKYPKYCIQEKLRQLNSYWKYKNTKLCYIKKKFLNHSTVLVLHPHLAVLYYPMLFNTINMCISGKHMFPIILSKAKRARFVWFFFFLFFFLLPSREKLQLTLQKCFCIELLLSQLERQLPWLCSLNL